MLTAHATHVPGLVRVITLLVVGLLLAQPAACGTFPPPDHCTVARPTGDPTLVVANSILYLQSESSDSLYALQANTGRLLWRYPASSLWDIEQGMVYVEGGNDSFYALQANDGTVRWKYAMSHDASSVVAVVDGLVYFSSSTTLTLYTLRASDGKRLWQHPVDTDHEPATVLAANGIAYVAAGHSRITALRERDGAELWQVETGSEPPGPPLSMTLGNGIVYASTNQTTALRASDGAVL